MGKRISSKYRRWKEDIVERELRRKRIFKMDVMRFHPRILDEVAEWIVHSK